MARYTESGRQEGELSAPEAAERLGLRSRTIVGWCKEALSGGVSKLSQHACRRDLAGRYWIQETEIEQLEAAHEREETL